MKNRIVSLIPSATEIVCALGCEDRLVGRSHECDYPPSIASLPACTAPKFNPEGTSREINERVKGLLQDVLSVYRVDVDRLKALQPDCIITQAQCEVCAVSLSEVEQAVSNWVDGQPSIVSLSPNRLADVWADVIRVADALGVSHGGQALATRLQARVQAITAKAKTLSPCPTVGCIEWLDPLMASANWMPELVELAGGRNLFGKSGEHAPWLTWEVLVKQDPDILLLLPCGFSISRTRQELPLLTNKPEWVDLKAVKNGNVFVTEGNQYFNRSGPRLVESLEILAEIFHPTAFDLGHNGHGWEKL